MDTLTTRMLTNAALAVTLVVLSAFPAPTAAFDSDVGLEIEIGKDKTVRRGIEAPLYPRDFLRFKSSLSREDPARDPVLMRVAADGSVWFNYHATVSFSPQGFSVTAGPHVGFVMIRVGELPLLIPLYLPSLREQGLPNFSQEEGTP